MAFNLSSDIEFECFMSLYKKYKSYFFLVIDATLASYNL